jgi:hypothetical protein
MAIAAMMFIGIDFWLLHNYRRYSSEIERLRSGMTDVERSKTDLLLQSDENRFEVMMELVRRQALGERTLHLSIDVDSSIMHLEREGARLRDMRIDVGPEKTVGVAPDTVRMTAPRGTRTVERILEGGTWNVPDWVYADLGTKPPGAEAVKGALGPVAILLTGGTVIYSRPTSGPLSDSSYVLPGSVRARADDLKAIAPNLKPGMKVYFY